MAKDYTQVNFRIPTKLKEEIEKARNTYENLDKKYKAIFNKDILRKLLEAENGKGDSITKVIAAIDALPAADGFL